MIIRLQIISCFLILFFSVKLKAQSPQDCINAIPICQDVYFETDAYTGTGDILNEISNVLSCLGSGEKNDVWYTFTVQSSGILNFSITPLTPSDDYDWAVFNLTNNPCSDISTVDEMEIACNYSGLPGITGPNGLAGEQNESTVLVEAGQTYVINVSQFTDASQDGYTIDFAASTAGIYDNEIPTISEVTAPVPCGSTTFQLVTSEYVKCNSVQASDFKLYDSGGNNIPIVAISSDVCNGGGNYDRYFQITVGTPLNSFGDYKIVIEGGDIEDLCTNFSLEKADTISFTIQSPAFIGTVGNVQVCQGTDPIIHVDGAGIYRFYQATDVNTVLLEGNNYNANTIANAVGSFNFLVSTLVNGCESEPKPVSVNVLPNDDATFIIPANYCIDSLTANPIPQFTNLTTIGGSFIISPNTAQINSQTGEIDLNFITNGSTYDITYITTGACQASTVNSITFNNSPTLNVLGVNPVGYCASETATTFTLEPQGGILSGNGVSNNIFNPNLAGVGTHSLTYTYTNSATQCSATTTFTVNVLPNPSSTFTAPAAINLSETATLTYTGNALSNATFNYNFDNATVLTGSGAGPYTLQWTTPGDKTLTLQVTDSTGCSSDVTTVQVMVSQPDEIIFPNAFSPNNDGVNDVFVAFNSLGVEKSSFEIFNRWGIKVFSSTNIFNEGWDGTYKNLSAKIGVYVYAAKITFTDGTEKIIKGNFTLIR